MEKHESGTIYGGPGSPSPAVVPVANGDVAKRRDWLIIGAVVVLAVGALVGVVMAVGAFLGGNGGAKAGGPPLAAAPKGGVTPPAVDPPPSTDPSPSTSLSPSASARQIPATSVLRNPNSSLCLEASGRGGDSDDDANRARMTQCTGAARQTWRISPASGKSYTLVNTATGKCLDVNGASDRDGAAIQEFRCHGGGNQRWLVRWSGTERFSLVGVDSNKCVDGGRKSGAEVEQDSCDGGASQEWVFGER